jgi:two-component system, OmpR family, alkaline phosphatase synthesis response regulator PhoP
LTQPTAIVVDDDKSLGLAFSIALRRSGFLVEQITDSTTALDVIERQRPDVVILDVNMPIVTGIDILHAMRKKPELTQIKVIIATAGGTITHDDEINDLADLVLLKPISLAQLTTFAARFLEQKQTQEMQQVSTEDPQPD